MSTRLQVVMEAAELEANRSAAEAEGVTLSEWVRVQLRKARSRTSNEEIDSKLEAIRRADHFSFPTADIDQMLSEIERGYGERPQ